MMGWFSSRFPESETVAVAQEWNVAIILFSPNAKGRCQLIVEQLEKLEDAEKMAALIRAHFEKFMPCGWASWGDIYVNLRLVAAWTVTVEPGAYYVSGRGEDVT